MSKDMTPKPSFDYGLVSQEQAMNLKTISIRLGVRVQRTAEEMLAMGADLREAKKVCKEDGTLFTAWCESSECPVGYQTATRLMSVHDALGDKNVSTYISQVGYAVISEVTRTRDEDMRAALLEHIEKEADNGKAVTQKEITALKRGLKEAQAKIADLQDAEFDARTELSRLASDLETAKRREKEATEKKDQYAKDLIEEEKKRKELVADLKAKLKNKQDELRDANDVHREHLEEMRAKIEEQARNRPRTDAEVQAAQAKLDELRLAEAISKAAVAQAEHEQERLREELLRLNRDVALSDRVLSDFGKAALQFRDVAMLMNGAAEALRSIPMTDALYEQVQIIKSLAAAVVTSMENATNVNQ
ncbi:hypothetical protein [uncultured Thiodictyon sp.]|uniref:hypothetical protein n=1 Tax=uncultured Thiodictyon sp. TaxID=1846217 RepID=UPI0025E4CD1D|nr:hypothetical protein [uncultured Thiodictyon sp.]